MENKLRTQRSVVCLSCELNEQKIIEFDLIFSTTNKRLDKSIQPSAELQNRREQFTQKSDDLQHTQELSMLKKLYIENKEAKEILELKLAEKTKEIEELRKNFRPRRKRKRFAHTSKQPLAFSSNINI